MSKHQLEGKIISHKTDKTAVVQVEKLKLHPRYLKRIKVSQKFQAHDPANEYQEGQKVVIEECRPQSKHKKWRIIRKIHDSSPDEIKSR